MNKITQVNGILLLYNHPPTKNAPTIMEHVNSFPRYSRFKVWPINVAHGFIPALEKLEFRVIVWHYSLFGVGLATFDKRFLQYVDRHTASYKIAFFQDEHQHCQQRFHIIDSFNLSCVYSLLDPAYFDEVYRKHTSVSKLVHTRTGYVDDDLTKMVGRFAKSDNLRQTDIGYRGRPLDFFMGKGSQEKCEIATRFLQHSRGLGLVLDIKTEERDRLYGDSWYKFLGNCKGCLGTEAGVSIFDLQDEVYAEYERLMSRNPKATYDDMPKELMEKWENKIPYRTTSPRHFEAAAFRVCQILYEGQYQGVMKPMVHYIPLKKDFSNFDEVMRLFRDESVRRELTDNCYRDLIASGQWSFRKFIDGFDQELMMEGFNPDISPDKVAKVTLMLKSYSPRKVVSNILALPYERDFPGKRYLVSLARPVYKRMVRGYSEGVVLKRIRQILRYPIVVIRAAIHYPWPDARSIVDSLSVRFQKKGDAPPIIDLSTGERTIVDSFWGVHTVIGSGLELVRSAHQDKRYLNWRFSVYPLFREFMGLWGDHNGQVVLDYGCGPGNDLVGFVTQTEARKVVGIDISEKALRFASWRLSLHQVDINRVELIRVSDSATTIPLESDSVDYIYSEGVLHHTSDPQVWLREFYRVLQPRGEACVMVYNRDSLYFHLYVAFEQKIRLGKFPDTTTEEAFTKSTDSEECPISRCYRPREFVSMCQSAGFKAEYVGGYFCDMELSLLKAYKEQALRDKRLVDEHKKFLNKLTIDDGGFPLYDGKACGVGGVYKLWKE